jgi:hypothetical protein
MQTYADWLATTVAAASSYTEARQAIDAYPRSVDVALAVASVRSWRTANC